LDSEEKALGLQELLKKDDDGKGGNRGAIFGGES